MQYPSKHMWHWSGLHTGSRFSSEQFYYEVDTKNAFLALIVPTLGSRTVKQLPQSPNVTNRSWID